MTQLINPDEHPLIRPWPAVGDPARIQRVRIVRYVDGTPGEGDDEVATEEPFEIRIAGQSVAMIMRTPGHDELLAAGFLLAEGVISGPDDILSMRLGLDRDGFPQGNVLDLRLRPELEVPERLTRRNFGVTSSCGLCGTASIEAVQARVAPVEDGLRIDVGVLAGLESALRQVQAVFARTGGLHAAGLFDRDGNLLAHHEDVGRHNAVDKVIGQMLLERRLPLAEAILLVSGRASFELVQKAAIAGIPIFAAIGAPSSLAVEMALAAHLTLIGLLRPPRFVVYTHPERLR